LKHPAHEAVDVTRRRLLQRVLASLPAAWMATQVHAHEAFGPVDPRLSLPHVAVLSTNGKSSDLATAMRGSVTALQLMFTGCSATCPIQGAVFAEAQQALGRAGPDLQLVSMSIDPLGDDIRSLRDWLHRFGAQPQHWSAALPRPQDVDRLLDFLRGRAAGAERHTPQVYVFDRDARLAYRTQDLPAADHLLSLMQTIALQR
jgi:protein SCO1